MCSSIRLDRHKVDIQKNEHTLLFIAFCSREFVVILNLKGLFPFNLHIQGYKPVIVTQFYIFPFLSILCFQSELHWRKGIPTLLPADMFSENYEVIPI